MAIGAPHLSLQRPAKLGKALLASVILLTSATTLPVVAGGLPLGTAITYQGRLAAGGMPVNGPVSASFRLYDAAIGGNLVGNEQAFPGLDVVNGMFVVDLDFGDGVFIASARWLEIEVNGEILTPRQPVLPAPLALYALNGNQGPIGPQGPAGAEGATGPMGLQGPAGADGAAGPTGPQGPAGAEGATGPMGPQGPAGAEGAIGPMGPQGPAGAEGAIGPMGPQGPAGAEGAIGPMGPQGPAGAEGAIGPMGPQGPAGAEGAIGPMGPQGPIGPTGETGPQGPAGGDSFWTLTGTIVSYMAGNVGIGTSTPSSVFAAKSSVDFGGITIQTGDNTLDQGIRFQNSTANFTWAVMRSENGTNQADLVFYGGTGNSDPSLLPERVRFARTGRVGIGTTGAPAARLHIGGTAGTDGIMFPDGTLQTTATLVGPAGPAGPAGPVGPAGPAGSSPWGLNGSDMTFTSGNVGIGTSAPTSLFEVKKGLNMADAARFTNSNGASQLRVNVTGNSTSGAGDLQAWNTSNETANPLAINPVGGNVAIGKATANFPLDVAGDARFASQLFTSGNAGIGTTSPTTRLEVKKEAAGTDVARFTNSTNLAQLRFDVTAGLATMQAINPSTADNLKLLLNPLGGKVGIGVADPTTPLDVLGNTHILGNVSVGDDNFENNPAELSRFLRVQGDVAAASFPGSAGLVLATPGVATYSMFTNTDGGLSFFKGATPGPTIEGKNFRLDGGGDLFIDGGGSLSISPDGGGVIPLYVDADRGNSSSNGLSDADYVAKFRNRNFAGSGIVVQIDAANNSRRNNYIMFTDEDTIHGRIEGFNYFNSVDWSPPALNSLDDVNAWMCYATELGLGMPDSLVGFATMVANANSAMLCRNNGVVYESGYGDYAEWLPRLDPNEKMVPGQIVGVFGGKISSKTDGAEQVMVISKAPIVLGNMPAKGDESLNEKVAFMGQVFTWVLGEVESGDYIVALGNSGYGHGKSAEELTVDDLGRIVGRAWDGQAGGKGLVNVVVGVEASEEAAILKGVEARLAERESETASLAHEVATLRGENEELRSRLDSLESLVQQLSATAQKSGR